MKCIHCEAEWKTKDSETTTIVKCPFCGENPQGKKTAPKFYDNTKDALAAIYKQFGADILLGKLKLICRISRRPLAIMIKIWFILFKPAELQKH